MCPVPGVQRIQIPLEEGPGSVSVFLIPADGGWLAIDCGPGAPDTLECYLAAGVDPGQIRTVLLTHAHPDHCGFAARLRSLSGAQVYLNRYEHESLKSLADPEGWLESQDEVLQSAAVPAEERKWIRAVSRTLRQEFPEFEVDGYIEDGDVFDTLLGPLGVLDTPGHTGGHLCFHLKDRKALFAGDHLVLGPQPHLDWAPRRDLAAEYIDSLYRIGGLDIDWVLSAHGRPRQAGRSVATDVLARLVERAERAYAAAGETPFAIARALYQRRLRPFELRMAVFEVLSLLGV